MSIEVSTESDPQSSDEDAVPPLYEVEIVDPYSYRNEKATFSVLEHAVKMAIACTSLEHFQATPTIDQSSWSAATYSKKTSGYIDMVKVLCRYLR